MERTTLDPVSVARFGFEGKPIPYAKGVAVAGATRLVFVSGQNAYDEQGNLVGPGDIAAQARQTLVNVRAVLEAAGATMDDVVKLTCWVTDPRYAPVYVEVRREFMREDRMPAASTVVSQLVPDGALIEIEALALL